MSQSIHLTGIKITAIRQKLVETATDKVRVVEVTVQCPRSIQTPSDMEMLSNCRGEGPVYSLDINPIQLGLELPQKKEKGG